MGSRGPVGRPELAKLRGSFRKDKQRLPTVVESDGSPQAPPWLTQSAAETFNELAARQAELGIGHVSDTQILAVLSDSIDRYRILSANAPDAETERMMARLRGSITSMLQSCGLCASARARLNLTTKPAAAPFSFGRNSLTEHHERLRRARANGPNGFGRLPGGVDEEYLRMQAEALDSRESDSDYDEFLREHRGETQAREA